MTTQEMQVKNKEEVQTKAEMTQTGIYFTPRVDIYETDDNIILIADMPGVKSSGVDIHLEKNELQIQGKVDKANLGSPLMAEYRIGNYTRSFTLTNMIDQDQIEASMKNGTLTVKMPKSEAAKPKKITVSTN